MDKTLLLSLSLTLLLFVSSSVAQQQQQNQCDINNLDALEPSNRVEYEGGIVETWNPNHQQFKCAGTAMMRVTMHPKAIITPLYSPAPVGVFVVQGMCICIFKQNIITLKLQKTLSFDFGCLCEYR